MVHAFLLVILLGDVKDRTNPMYFRNINDCNYFAQRVVKKYGNYYNLPKNHIVTAYCKPAWISSNTKNLY